MASGSGHSLYRQRHTGGAILLLAMVFILLLAMLVATVLQGAALQFRMAGNHQFQEEAVQRALALAEELSLRRENFILGGDVGHTVCAIAASDSDCDENLLSVPAAANVPQAVELDYRITRQSPRFASGFVLRESQKIVSSSRHFQTAVFEVEVRVTGTGERSGSAHLVRGVALRHEVVP